MSPLIGPVSYFRRAEVMLILLLVEKVFIHTVNDCTPVTGRA